MNPQSPYKTVLITGGAGFIGSRLALHLLAAGYSVKILDSLSQQIHGNDAENNSPLFLSIKDKVTFIKGDLCNRKDVEKAVAGVDVIFHLAAETGTGQSMYEISKYTFVNTYGSSLLMDVLANTHHQVKKIILASSRAVYGEGKYADPAGGVVYPSSRQLEWLKRGIFSMTDVCGNLLQPLPTDEDSKLAPVSIYGLTKVQQEQLILMGSKALGIHYSILRFQNVYGAGQSLKNPYTGILSIFSTLINHQKEINIFEDGKPARDFIYIEDVVEACKRCMERAEADNQIINIGTGIPTTVIDVAQKLAKLYEIPIKMKVSGDFRVGDIRYNVADLGKMKFFLDFTPKIDLDEGLKMFVDWVKQQHLEDNAYENSLEEMRKRGLLYKA